MLDQIEMREELMQEEATLDRGESNDGSLAYKTLFIFAMSSTSL
jgi:hypothetical protein